MYLIVGSEVDLFREALPFYQNGAFITTIVMCRVVLELYFTISAIRDRATCDWQGRIWKVEPNDTVYHFAFGRIIESVRRPSWQIKSLRLR